jgi:hypothetical protein
MAIKMTLNEWDFQNAFKDFNRDYYTRYDLLFNYYNELDDDFDLDVIAICGEWDEFSNVDEYNKNYGSNYDSLESIANDYNVLYDDINKPFLVESH